MKNIYKIYIYVKKKTPTKKKQERKKGKITCYLGPFSLTGSFYKKH